MNPGPAGICEGFNDFGGGRLPCLPVGPGDADGENPFFTVDGEAEEDVLTAAIGTNNTAERYDHGGIQCGGIGIRSLI